MNPDDLAELEDERRFLLRSLGDLEREREAGDIDEQDYASLKDGYTARAAGVLRSIEEGTASLPPAPPRRWGRLVAGVVLTAAVAVGGGILVARNAGQRGAGDSATGSIGDSTSKLLAEARTKLGTDHPGAVARYDQVLATDPSNVEAITYKGWLVVQDGQLGTGEALIDKAITLQSDYPDARFFKGFVLLNQHKDPAGSLDQFDIVLTKSPGSDIGKGAAQLADQAVGQLLDQARSQLTSDPVHAAQTYGRILAFDPQNPSANSYLGFLLAQAGQVDAGLGRLDKAIAQQKDFPDAHFLKATVLLDAKRDPAGAITEIDAFLALNPPAEGVDQANALRKQAQDALAQATAATTAPAAPTTTHR